MGRQQRALKVCRASTCGRSEMLNQSTMITKTMKNSNTQLLSLKSWAGGGSSSVHQFRVNPRRMAFQSTGEELHSFDECDSISRALIQMEIRSRCCIRRRLTGFN